MELKAKSIQNPQQIDHLLIPFTYSWQIKVVQNKYKTLYESDIKKIINVQPLKIYDENGVVLEDIE